MSLTIAIIAPLGAEDRGAQESLIADLAQSLAWRGHRVRVYATGGLRIPDVRLVPCGFEGATRAAMTRVFRRLRADGADAVSHHAFDAEAFHLAEGLPVLHTLHMPPRERAIVDACRQSIAPVVTLSEYCAEQWRAAGVERVRAFAPGVPDFALPNGLVRPQALIAPQHCGQKGTVIAERAAIAAGLAPRMLSAGIGRPHRWQLMAQSAVCLLPVEQEAAFELVAAEAQMAGCPVVGYARGALAEIVEQDVSGILVPAGDERALAAAARRAQWLDRRRVRESAHDRLLLGPMVERYERELAAIAERHRPKPARVLLYPG